MWVTFLLQIARTICQFYRIVCWNDALNVLTAMDIISKDKKEIHWKGMPHTTPNHIQELKSERLAIQNRFEMKSAYLQELEDQTPSHAEVEIEMSENTHPSLLTSMGNTPFELHYDNYALKEMKLCGRSKRGDDIAKGGSVDDMAISGSPYHPIPPHL
uniref:Transcription factor DP C-terminal domain-containing protein n=1 Tax=Lactuca sativa TaxID=4236 RepID=A0A9R1XUX8_LACSA|nr:hypothetical protein LSAT_V11C200090160 [Lactuca sativa]